MFTNAIRMFVEVIRVPTEALVSGLEPLSCKYNKVDTTDKFVIHETKCSKKRRNTVWKLKNFSVTLVSNFAKNTILTSSKA